MRPLSYSTIHTPEDLARMTEALSTAPVIALDTEASSFHRYRVRVCLVQVSDRDRTWLVDPFTAGDLAPLGTLLGRPEMEVVIHDADYDLRMLAQEQGIDLSELPIDALRRIHPDINEDVYEKALTLEASLHARNTLGGTAPAQVQKQLARHLERLAAARA